MSFKFPNRKTCRWAFSARTWVLFAGVAGLQCGCVAVVPYTPDETLVAKSSIEDGKRRLSEVLNRAVQPHVTSVDVTADYVRFGWTETVPGPFYAPVTTSHESQIYYANIGRIEIYANHNVFVWGPGDQRVDKALFSNAEDAKLFADLLMSLRASRR